MRELERALPWFLVLVTLAVFLPAAGYGFINHDDGGYIFQNRSIADGLTADAVTDAFTKTFVGSWFPLSIVSHALDVQLFGLNATGHHVVSILLHALSTLLLFNVLKGATGRVWPSAAAALLFAVHPLHVEPVVWVSSRKDVLSTFFLIATLWAHARYAQTPALRRYLAALALFTAGMLAKSTIVTLPLALVLFDYWPLGRIASRRDVGRRLVEKLPMLAIGLAIVFINAWMIAGDVADADYRPLSIRLMNAVTAGGAYLWMTVFPAGLTPYYPYPYHWGLGVFAASAAVLAALAAAAVLTVKSRPYLFTGLFWFAGTLVPVLGVVQYSDHLIADHYTYVPHIGLFIAMAWLAADVLSKLDPAPARAVVAGFLVGVVGAWLAVTLLQVQLWSKPSRLYERSVAKGPPSPVAYMLLGGAYLHEGELEAALPAYEAALQLAPDLVPALNDLGMLYGMTNRLAEAQAAFSRALELDPDFAAAQTNLRVVREEIARVRAEIADLTARLQQRETAALHAGLASAYLQLEDRQRARAHLDRALELDPDFEPANELDATLNRNFGVSSNR